MLGPALHQLLETIALLAAMVHLPTGQCAVLLGLVITITAGTASRCLVCTTGCPAPVPDTPAARARADPQPVLRRSPTLG